MPRNPSALLAVPLKASGAMPNTLALAVDNMDGAALDTGGVGCWATVRAGCFPLDVDVDMVGGFWGVSGSVVKVDSRMSFAVACSMVWWLVLRSCDTSATSPSSSEGKMTGWWLS